MDHIAVKNCLYWWKLATRFSLKTVGIKARHVMISEFEGVAQTEDFLQLSMVELEEYVRHPELKVSHQDKLLHACILWILANVESRKQYVLEILKLVKLDECTTSTFSELIKTHRELFSDLTVKHGVITVKNCLYWWNAATRFNLKTVAVLAKNVMVTDFESVSQLEGFSQMSKVELEEYITHPELKIPHQDKLLHVCISWVLAEEEARKQYMLELLKLVKLDECTPSTLSEVIKMHGELFSDLAVKALVFDKVLPNLTSPKPKTEAAAAAAVAVKQKVLLLGGVMSMNGVCPVFEDCWSVDGCHLTAPSPPPAAPAPEGAWERVTTLPEKLRGGKQTAFVCVPGGFAALCAGPSRTVCAQYDAARGAWLDLPAPPARLTSVVPLYSAGKIHVLDGGLHSGVRTAAVLALDLFYMTWSVAPTLLVKQFRPIAAAHRQSLYVVLNDDYDEDLEASLQVRPIVCIRYCR